MTNAELIKAARICANQTCCDNCPRYDIDHTQDAQRCCIQLINDAADALEAADKRIEQLEKQVVAHEKLVKRCGKRMSKLETENENLQDNLREKIIMLQRAKEGYVDA